MPAAMTALATITLGSAASSVTFGSIPATYRDLLIVANFGVSADIDVSLTFNSDTGANYQWVVMRGNGSSAASNSGSARNYLPFAIQNEVIPTTNTVVTNAHILDYSATDKHKTVLRRTDMSSTQTLANAGRWASTSAIGTVAIAGVGGTLNSGSTFSLYGISA